MTNQRVQKRDVNATRRVALALELRAQRLTYDEIARRCGYGSPGAAYKAVQREMERVIVANVEELRREELAMLDSLHAAIYLDAVGKSEAPPDDDDGKCKKKRTGKADLWAVDRVLTISEARRKLMGLDMTPDDARVAAQRLIREYPADAAQGV